ncbi:MAG TPA: hypothetical protein VFQ85_04920 [Mycobacteriales bacterium]|jgi:hypothetical protein|nr:hypothetical protein [Mycobacteriales bacterium]
MTLRIALLAAAGAAVPFLLVPAAATAAAPCVPRTAGDWCFDSGDPTKLPCIEANRDPVWARLVDCH